jgi:Fungal N-terminal domain of STAND proteins
MQDPLALATSFTNLLVLATELSKTIGQYTLSVKNAAKDAQVLCEELAALSPVLEQMVQFLHTEKSKFSAFDDTSVLCSAVHTCQDKLQYSLRIFTKILEGGILTQAWERLKWPFDEKENRQTVNTLHRCAQTFQFSLTVRGW